MTMHTGYAKGGPLDEEVIMLVRDNYNSYDGSLSPNEDLFYDFAIALPMAAPKTPTGWVLTYKPIRYGRYKWNAKTKAWDWLGMDDKHSWKNVNQSMEID